MFFVVGGSLTNTQFKVICIRVSLYTSTNVMFLLIPWIVIELKEEEGVWQHSVSFTFSLSRMFASEAKTVISVTYG